MEPQSLSAISGKTILVAPVDWGMGHATRCAALIRLLSAQNTLIVGCSSGQDFYFGKLFPELRRIRMPSYGIRYSSILPAYLMVLLQSPRIWKAMRQEKRILEDLLSASALDMVISDCRFGLHSTAVQSVLLTHQLRQIMPFGRYLANWMNARLINRFSEIWVPDYESGSKRLSGQLSEPRAIKPPLRFIGPMSLFSGISVKDYQSETVELLLLLSGPEPQRSILEKILLERFGHSGSGTILIRGSYTKFQAGDYSIRIHDFLDEKELAPYLSNAKTVICRSGYSTLMDLHASGQTKIILIPTPGQPEQEYLARYWSEHFGSGFCYQNEAKTCRFQAV